MQMRKMCCKEDAHMQRIYTVSQKYVHIFVVRITGKK